jgi:hypothetical protein
MVVNMTSAFDVLILIARPAAGKSEIIAYLRSIERELRTRRFYIGDFEELDDFPMLWTWFEEDLILERMGRPRLHTTSDGYFRYEYLWDLLIRRINLEYRKRTSGGSRYPENMSTIIEFSRGAQHGGYRRAFAHLSEEILDRAAVLYIDVSYEESLRKNRRRFNPERPHSVLEHGLPDDKMDVLYRESDWESFSAPDPRYLRLENRAVPYAVFENEDDVTTTGGEPLCRRLERTLHRLWETWNG